MSATKTPLIMENIAFGIIAILLLAYLVVAVLRPEKF
ncbi:MAG: K(+)-transporting ATPase subunit F [Opitutaceae bacterium]